MRIIRIASHSSVLDSFISGAATTKAALSDDNLWDALVLLKSIDEYHATRVMGGVAGITDPASLNAYIGSLRLATAPTSLSYLSAIYRSITIPVVRTLFNPFIGLLAIASATAGAAPIADLTTKCGTIINYGSNLLYGTRAQQYPMFEKLFEWFKNKIKTEASSVNPALATAVAGGALLDYKSLFAAAGKNLGKPQSAMYTISNTIIDDIMRKRFDPTRYLNQNIEIIKEKFMYTFGDIKEDQRKQIEKERKEEELAGSLPSSVAPGAARPLSIEERKPFAVTNKEWLSPYFLTSLLVFFIQYRNKVGSLPD